MKGMGLNGTLIPVGTDARRQVEHRDLGFSRKARQTRQGRRRLMPLCVLGVLYESKVSKKGA
jgi:hypothetical protein